jgi:asparagine synthase (glutamine-hydrolysing)
MCGIFASTRGRMRVWDTLQLMKHRGPDQSDVRVTKPFSVGLARLSIVDTKNLLASQPSWTRRENIVAFNGEIYNYRSLWRNAPSEVKLLGDMLDEGVDPRLVCEGDYAILYYNPSAQTVTLYRDRFGVVPLYYSISPEGIEVSSEARRLDRPRAVPAHGRVRIDLRKRKARVDAWPLHGAINHGVTKMPARIPVLAEALENAVLGRALHTDSDFSLALSGGLDSTLILAALCARDVRPKACITTGFSSRSDDLNHSAIACDHFRMPWLVSIISKERMAEHDRNIREHFDSAVPNAMRWRGGLRSYFAAQIAPTKVILCGDGADELLGGYPSHLNAAALPDLNKNYAVSAKRLSTLRSMASFNLDRTNKMGMAWSKEYRPPLLESSLANLLLAEPFTPRKQIIRDMLRYYGAPSKIIEREYKYSADELAIN